MLRAKVTEAAWIAAARESHLASFATSVAADRDAIAAAIAEPWSNGQTKGQITKLKLVKRQMYGRAKLDLLRAGLVNHDLHEIESEPLLQAETQPAGSKGKIRSRGQFTQACAG